MNEHRIFQAIAIGIVGGMPLSILGELFLTTSVEASSLHTLGQILTATRGLFLAITGMNAFANEVTFSIYMLIQAFYFMIASYVLLSVIHFAVKRSV